MLKISFMELHWYKTKWKRYFPAKVLARRKKLALYKAKMCAAVYWLWEDRRRRRRLQELRNQGEEVWSAAVQGLKAKRVRDILSHAERALTNGKAHAEPRELGAPLSYHYNYWQIMVHRLRDPKLRDVRLGVTVPSFRGELFTHQHQALESEQRAGTAGRGRGGAARRPAPPPSPLRAPVAPARGSAPRCG